MYLYQYMYTTLHSLVSSTQYPVCSHTRTEQYTTNACNYWYMLTMLVVVDCYPLWSASVWNIIDHDQPFAKRLPFFFCCRNRSQQTKLMVSTTTWKNHRWPMLTTIHHGLANCLPTIKRKLVSHDQPPWENTPLLPPSPWRAAAWTRRALRVGCSIKRNAWKRLMSTSSCRSHWAVVIVTTWRWRHPHVSGYEPYEPWLVRG